MDDELRGALLLRENGQDEDAREILKDLAARYPDNGNIQYQAASVHDSLGFEREAVPLYERALELELTIPERSGAMLGLGSTLRTLGQYDRASAILREAADLFPDMRCFDVFLAMSLYNEGRHHEAMERLLLVAADTSEDDSIRTYERAIRYYADRLDETW